MRNHMFRIEVLTLGTMRLGTVGSFVAATGLVMLSGCGIDDPSAFQESSMAGQGRTGGASILSGCETSPTPDPCPEAALLSDEFDAACTLSAYAGEQLDAVVADIDTRADGRLVATFTPESPANNGWYQDWRGPGLFKSISGNFIARTLVTARSVASADLPPTQDFNSAGFLIRDPASATGNENWVMYDIGFQNGVVGTESKTTQNSNSVLTIHPTGGQFSAELVVCREGADLRMFRRHGADQGWIQDNAFSRPDLPQQLETGLILNGWENPPDLQAEFEYVRYETAPQAGDCSVAGLNALYPAEVVDPCPAASGFSDEFNDECSLSAWTGINLDAATVDIDGRTDGQLTLTFDAGSPMYYGWYQDYAGPFLHKPVTGNFLAVTQVSAHHSNDANLPPTSQYNSAGILARDPASVDGNENWLVYNLGFQENSVATEGKTTDNSVSVLTLLPTGGVFRSELAMCRFGANFRLFRRLETETGWRLEHTYSRPDLPATLDLGLMANAWQSPATIRAEYDYIRLTVPTSEADCSEAALNVQIP